MQQQHVQQLQMFWQHSMLDIENEQFPIKHHQLPLARIKRIMKSDEDVRMISAEAPVLFAKACELFILELTLRAWVHTEENKRRTLQRNDIAMAITKTDTFDFLIDIVLRDDIKIMKKMNDDTLARQPSLPAEQLQYFYQLAQHQAAAQAAQQQSEAAQQQLAVAGRMDAVLLHSFNPQQQQPGQHPGQQQQSSGGGQFYLQGHGGAQHVQGQRK